jgi:3-phenylpropionate/trans-cinnamate dioxygenase ferredoxin subunit
MASVQVATTDDIPPGSMKAFPVGDTQVLVAHCGDAFYAVSNRCTHMGGNLAAGRLEGFVVICPRHGSSFDVRTGANVVSPKIGPLKMKAADLDSYPIVVEGETIKVTIV